MRKVTSKKDYPYVVETNDDESKVKKVGDFVSPSSYVESKWEYFVCYDSEDYDFEDKLNKAQLMLPIISFEEWQNLPEYDPKEVAFKDFVLPEKWFVQVDKENKSTINNWRDSELYSEYGFVNQDGVWLPELIYFDSDSIKITFEQFKEHVLGEKPKERKIIGYKLVKEEYKEAVKVIIGNEKWFNDNFDANLLKYGYNFGSGEETAAIIFSVQNTIELAGVMHWFSPVYEEEKITLKSGVELTKEDIEEVKEIFFF